MLTGLLIRPLFPALAFADSSLQMPGFALQVALSFGSLHVPTSILQMLSFGRNFSRNHTVLVPADTSCTSAEFPSLPHGTFQGYVVEASWVQQKECRKGNGRLGTYHMFTDQHVNDKREQGQQI